MDLAHRRFNPYWDTTTFSREGTGYRVFIYPDPIGVDEGVVVHVSQNIEVVSTEPPMR